MTVILHLSDTHLDGTAGPAQRLRDALRLAAVRRPDAIVVTGDLADTGAPIAYRQFLKAIDIGVPWLAVPGNHDHRPAYEQQMPGMPAGLDVQPGLRVVGLDVTVPGQDHGELSDAAAAAARRAARGALQVVLAMHHPPVAIGHAAVDRMRLHHPDRLRELIAQLPPVAAILCGHIHTALAASFAGVAVLAAPGVASSLGTDPDRRPIADVHAPPGFALHQFGPGAGPTSSFHFS